MKKKKLVQVVFMILPLLLLSLWSFGQSVKVQGTVTDEGGDPMPGVNVVIKGTTSGSITDLNGKYQIDADSKSTLTFSFIGFVNQDMNVGKRKEINVKLISDNIQMDEVVVVGYGVQRKSDVTGSVTSVKSEAIMSSAPTDIRQALQGKAAGVLITQGGNGVNANPVIRIRGNRSIGASNDPLFVVDGVPAFDGTNMVNPNDVQSVEILKDASATAIYGSRGANGVILITTKKGEKGKVTVEYNGDYSVSDLGYYRKQMNGEEFMEYQRDVNRKYTYDQQGGYAINTTSGYGYNEPNYTKDLGLTWVQNPYIMESLKQAWATGTYIPGNLRTFDWQMDGVRQHPTSQTHSISVRGGSENTQVYFSGSFNDLTDTQLQSYRKRYTLRSNIDQKIGKRITTGVNVNFSYTESDGGQWMASYWNPLGTPWYSPDGDVTKAGDPAYGIIPQPCGDNLLYSNYLDLVGNKRQNLNNNLSLSSYVAVTLIKGLIYKATFGTVLNMNNINSFNGHLTSATSLGTPKASKQDQISRSWSFENNLSYNTKILEHSIGVTLVQTNEKSIYNTTTASGVGIPIESQTWNALGNATAQATGSGYTQWQLQSYLGRLTYSFKDRYLFTGSMRYDGSSRLAPGHKWVAFPSLALGWRVTEEGFMKGITWLDNLKLRAGYGVTGNASVGTYSTIGTITSSRYNWASDVLAPGYIPNSMSNSGLTWEKTAQYNAGIDASVFNGRVSATIDVYMQKTSDLLMNRSLPDASGFGSITANVGATQNKGIEIGLTTENIKTQKFSWESTINWAKNKEEITKLNSGLSQDLANSWFVGQPISTYYNYVAYPTVIWGYSKEDFAEMAKFNANGSAYAPGQLRLADLNGDYKITDADREIRGSRMPKFTASLANTFTYGAFDLYVFMNSAFGNTIYWDPGNPGDGKLNQAKYVYENYWTPSRTNGTIIQPTGGNPPTNIAAAQFWKGDYVRVNDITLGYTLNNKNLLKKAGIQKLRLSLKVVNPVQFTKFPGVDPEGAISQGGVGAYGDQSYLMRTYKFGLNVTF